MDNNIVLIGFMGCGKTSVGKRLAEKMGFEFLDTDEYIEKKENRKVSDIFAKEGEEYFRNAETNSIKELLHLAKRTIIATGGGMPLREENRGLLKELGLVLYLKANKDITIKRLKSDTTRPLLAGGDLEEKVDRLLKDRRSIYEATAHHTIITNKKSFEKIIKEILRQYNSKNSLD